jgi:glycosyltransferase involved in cell wall biosynthesis
MEVELTEPLRTVCYDGRHRQVWVLGRLHTEPIGACLIQLGPEGLNPGQLSELLWRELRTPVNERFAAAGFSRPRALPGDGLAAGPCAWPFLRRRSEVLAAAPFISVIICTRDRPDQLATCLRHLDRQAYPRFEVVVVENVPDGDAVRTLVEARRGGVPYHYLTEPRSGLSWARNTGITAASGEIIAFLDDDDEPDSHWLAGLACGFARGDDIGCVTGLVVPARLDTPAEQLFEHLGGHSKGRGFELATFSRHGPQSPLYPLPPFGAGANMAFRREALASIGGFDVALGAGTPALAGADTLALTLTLLAGYRITYQPAALMWHHHRRDLDGLRRQLHGYSVGLTAYYAALLRHRPGVFADLLKLAPIATGYLRGTMVAPVAAPPDLLAALNRRHRRGMLMGPLEYVRSMRTQARVAAVRAVPPKARK